MTADIVEGSDFPVPPLGHQDRRAERVMGEVLARLPQHRRVADDDRIATEQLPALPLEPLRIGVVFDRDLKVLRGLLNGAMAHMIQELREQP